MQGGRWRRIPVEHTSARMKNGTILRSCRQKGDGLHHAAATMHNLALTGETAAQTPLRRHQHRNPRVAPHRLRQRRASLTYHWPQPS
ncbi:hypothetical protein B6R96_25690 [Streptomyces sp. Sge12]|nr:hypothetical protein B6R96_25690 [Streptomyces sp. Sge12]